MTIRNQSGARVFRSPIFNAAALRPLGALVLAVIALALTGCTYDPIFASIESEVALADPTLRGTITSMARVGTDLYAANGKISERTGGTGSWETIAIPDFRCYEIATDGTSLYALFQDSDYSPVAVRRWDSSAKTWTAIGGLSSAVRIGSGNGLVFAFTENGSAWDAWTVAPAAAAAVSLATGLGQPVGSVATASASYFATASGVYDATGTLVPGCPTEGILGITADDTGRVYVADSGTLYQYVGTSTWNSCSHGGATPVNDIAWLGGGTTGKNLVMVAGATGYTEVLIDGSGNMTGYQDPGDSASSSIGGDDDIQNQYDNSIAQWVIQKIFAFRSAELPAMSDSYAIYASVYHYTYDGLWAFYPSSRAEWNRE